LSIDNKHIQRSTTNQVDTFSSELQANRLHISAEVLSK